MVLKLKILFSLFFLLLLSNACNYHEMEEIPQPVSVLDIEITDKKIEITDKIPSYSRIANGTLQIGADFKKGELPYTLDRRENSEEREMWKMIGIVIENDTMIAVERRQINYGELKVENGAIVGINLGEFGGGIKFKPNSGIEYEILNENFIGFYTVKKKKFAITGLAHMGSDDGCLYELIFIDDKWQANKILDIESRPKAFLAVNEDLFVVTDKTLLLIKNGNTGVTVDVLIDDAFWSGYFPFSDGDFNYRGTLTPESMIYADNSIYIGMYGGVYMYNLNTGMDMWYDYLPVQR